MMKQRLIQAAVLALIAVLVVVLGGSLQAIGG